VLAIAFTVIALLQRPGAGSGIEQPPGVPVLFEAAVRCGREAEGARHHGLELEARALAKNERAPWRAQDGVEAALFLAEARACYALGGDSARAAALTPMLERWQRRLNTDYQRFRLLLEFSLRKAEDSRAEQGRVPPALAAEISTQVSRLRALLVHHDGSYREWLDKLARRYAQEETRS
jgi:hypothetical protein